MGNDKRRSQTNYRKGLDINSVPVHQVQHKKDFKTKPKDGYILYKGKVIEAYPNALFLVEVDDIGSKVSATLAGKLRQNYIRILVGDRVELEISIYDPTKGRIARRL